MLEVITNCCSKTYLDMMHHAAMTSNSWNMKYPIGLEPKHLKLDIIENEPLEPILAGMAILRTSPGMGSLVRSIRTASQGLRLRKTFFWGTHFFCQAG